MERTEPNLVVRNEAEQKGPDMRKDQGTTLLLVLFVVVLTSVLTAGIISTYGEASTETPDCLMTELMASLGSSEEIALDVAVAVFEMEFYKRTWAKAAYAVAVAEHALEAAKTTGVNLDQYASEVAKAKRAMAAAEADADLSVAALTTAVGATDNVKANADWAVAKIEDRSGCTLPPTSGGGRR